MTIEGQVAWITGASSGIGAALASMSIYIVMALILAFRPKGLYSAQG